MSAIDVTMREDEKPFYTPAALARKLAISERSCRSLLERGEIASYKVGGLRRIDPADVADYLARHRSNGNGNGR